MSYNDPCANDPEHDLAVVGVGGATNASWVCMACFEDYLATTAATVRTLLPADPVSAHGST